MFNHPISSLSAIQIFPPRNGFRDLLLSFDEIFHQVLRTPYREVTGPCGVHGFRPLRQLNLFRIWGQGLWGIELQTSQRGGAHIVHVIYEKHITSWFDPDQDVNFKRKCGNKPIDCFLRLSPTLWDLTWILAIWHSVWHCNWQIFWNSILHDIWQIFWNSNWRSIWHSIWHSITLWVCTQLTYLYVKSTIWFCRWENPMKTLPFQRNPQPFPSSKRRHRRSPSSSRSSWSEKWAREAWRAGWNIRRVKALTW